MQIKWKTIKIDKDNLAHLAFEEVDSKAPGKATKDPEKPVHPDFLAAMKRLTPHFALLCEQLETPANINDFKSEELDNFIVRGYHWGNNEEIPGISIVGHKLLKSGKALGLNAPFLRFYEDAGQENAYPFQELLQHVLTLVESEAKLYINGKFCPDPQPELPFGEDNGDKSKTTVEVLDPVSGSVYEAEKPAKGGRKKKEAVTE